MHLVFHIENVFFALVKEQSSFKIETLFFVSSKAFSCLINVWHGRITANIQIFSYRRVANFEKFFHHIYRVMRAMIVAQYATAM